MQSQQPQKNVLFLFFNFFFLGFLLLLRISKNKIRKFNNTTGDHCITLFQFFCVSVPLLFFQRIVVMTHRLVIIMLNVQQHPREFTLANVTKDTMVTDSCVLVGTRSLQCLHCQQHHILQIL